MIEKIKTITRKGGNGYNYSYFDEHDGFALKKGELLFTEKINEIIDSLTESKGEKGVEELKFEMEEYIRPDFRKGINIRSIPTPKEIDVYDLVCELWSLAREHERGFPRDNMQEVWERRVKIIKTLEQAIHE